MSHRVRGRASAETPIERIFQKVMRRKMTSQERIYFHLKRKIKPHTGMRSWLAMPATTAILSLLSRPPQCTVGHLARLAVPSAKT